MNRPIPVHFSATLLLLAVTFAADRATTQRKPGRLAQPLDSIETQLAGFSGVDNPELNDAVLKQLKPTSYLARTYRAADFEADLFIGFYAQQRAGESMHSPKHCLPGSGWEIWNYDTVDIPVMERSFTVNKYSISRASDRRLVFYWYQSKNRIFTSEYLGKLLLARDALLQNSTSGSIVRIIVPDTPGAADKTADLVSALIPRLERCFGR